MPTRRGEPGRMAIAVKPPPQPTAPSGEDGGRFEGLVLDFLSYLELERGLSRNTLNAYRTDLLQFGEFLAARKGDALAARPDRRRRVPRRAGDRQRPPALLGGDDPPQGRLPALLLQAPAPRGADRRGPDRRAEPLRGGRESFPRSSTTPRSSGCWRRRGATSRRRCADRALLEVMYACGLRASETIGLELSDVDLQHGFLRARGKGSKERLVPLGRQAVAAVSALPAQRPAGARRRSGPSRSCSSTSAAGR